MPPTTSHHPAVATPSSGRPRRLRRHRTRLEPAARRSLERAGWRTMLEHREDHVRDHHGRLIEVRTTWIAEAERAGSSTPLVLTAAAGDADAAWAELAHRALSGAPT